MVAIEQYQKLFLEKYNAEKTRDRALSRAISAAVQHNRLYSRDLSNKHRASIRGTWKNVLVDTSRKYKSTVSVKQYENDVAEIKKRMNDEFLPFFQTDSEYDDGFRISHAQKGLSVFLKHLWCLGEIAEPSICPIDRIVLKATNAKRLKDIAWGYVNSIEEHRRKFYYIILEAKKASLPVAVWELVKFS